MRQKIVAGNWKMNNTLNETKELLKGLKKELKGVKLDNTRVIIAPTFVNLQHAVKKTAKSVLEVSAQNLHEAKNGAFTGEISADMLLDIGVNVVILGHSERRAYFNETDEALAQKVNTAVAKGLDVIFCFGEQLEDRQNENHFSVVESQLKEALFGLQAEAFKNIILAYEPVWAIGTGQTATADQAQEMHEFIRGLLAKSYDAKLADNVSILYGGSVKPNNAEEIFSKPDVDGGLIGGASLKEKDFSAIVKSI
ncbi:triose-phosphate isomerase [uncultured Tenacibaculum sp.]|uniref:triose-phosphate isomerase n=1 Tax=uncultured Tenacibaculum sp. TaxID=174713 RepID=UPI002627DFCF|nr:triose-phosphate isomerase [uncultured Tenacibaculum sp.]